MADSALWSGISRQGWESAVKDVAVKTTQVSLVKSGKSATALQSSCGLDEAHNRSWATVNSAGWAYDTKASWIYG